MPIPEPVKKLTTGFHQDIFLIEPTLDGAIENASRYLSLDEQAVVKRFLTDLLVAAPEPGAIRKVWDNLPKDIRIDDDADVIGFLTSIRDRMAGG